MKKRQLSPWFLTLFSLPFLGVGIFMGWLVYSTYAEAEAMKEWNEVPAVITHAELESHSGDDSTTYECIATYEYEVDGKKYVGDRVAIGSGSDNIGSYQRDKARELKGYFKSKKPFRCYVDPADPNNAVLYRELRTEMLGFYAIFVAAFGTAGLGMFIGSLVMMRKQRVADTALQRHPGEPWRVKPEWTEGRIRSSGLGGVFFMGMFAVIWNAISTPMVLFVILPEIADGNYILVVFLSFPLIGLAVFGAFLYMLLRHFRYGVSVFHMAKVPGILGGPLSGAVMTKVKVSPTEAFEVKLENRRVSGNGKHSNTITLWKTSRRLRGDLAEDDPTHSAIPVLFAIPFDAEETSLEEQISWHLTVEAKTPGIDYKAEFEVPVFRTEESREDFVLDEEPIRKFEV